MFGDDPERFVTANAYLGCFGIVEALNAGRRHRDHRPGHRCRRRRAVRRRGTTAGRVTTSTNSPGAVVAGHVIECSAQATGGNYSFFTEIEGRDEVGGRARFGFPWAEVAADGSSVIGKHDGTGGAVTIGTVTSQLLYEITGHEYLGPDVTARFDTIELEQVGARPGPHQRRARAGAAVDAQGGDERTRRLPQLVHRRAHRSRHRREGGARRGDVLGRLPVRTRRLRLDRQPGRPHRQGRPRHAGGGDRDLAGHGQGSRRAQGGPGVRRRDGRTPRWPASRGCTASAVGRVRGHRSGCIGRRRSRATSCRSTSTSLVRPRSRSTRSRRRASRSHSADDSTSRAAAPSGPTVDRPLGALVGTRSGDKGGDANLGVFVRTDDGLAVARRVPHRRPAAGAAAGSGGPRRSSGTASRRSARSTS